MREQMDELMGKQRDVPLDERDAAKAALEDVQKAQKEGEAGLAAATAQVQAGEVATREHA